MARTDGVEDERFAPTSGRGVGISSLILLAVFLVVAFVADDARIAPWGVALMLFLGVLVWAAMLRPRVAVEDGRLVLRGVVETISIPMAAIESASVRQFLAVWVRGKRYVSPAVGRTRRTMRRDEGGPRGGVLGAGFGGLGGGGGGGTFSFGSQPDVRGSGVRGGEYADRSYGYFVQDRIVELAEQARSAAPQRADDPVERRPAWVEIAALVVTGVATVVLFVV